MYLYLYTIYIYIYIQREIMLFIGKPKGRSMMISNIYHIYTYIYIYRWSCEYPPRNVGTFTSPDATRRPGSEGLCTEICWRCSERVDAGWRRSGGPTLLGWRSWNGRQVLLIYIDLFMHVNIHTHTHCLAPVFSSACLLKLDSNTFDKKQGNGVLRGRFSLATQLFILYLFCINFDSFKSWLGAQ